MVTVTEAAPPPIICCILSRIAGGMDAICCSIRLLYSSILAAACFIAASISASVISEYSFFLWSIEMILAGPYSTIVSFWASPVRIFSAE